MKKKDKKGNMKLHLLQDLQQMWKSLPEKKTFDAYKFSGKIMSLEDPMQFQKSCREEWH